jgi:hypothetical protein
MHIFLPRCEMVVIVFRVIISIISCILVHFEQIKFFTIIYDIIVACLFTRYSYKKVDSTIGRRRYRRVVKRTIHEVTNKYNAFKSKMNLNLVFSSISNKSNSSPSYMTLSLLVCSLVQSFSCRRFITLSHFIIVPCSWKVDSTIGRRRYRRVVTRTIREVTNEYNVIAFNSKMNLNICILVHFEQIIFFTIIYDIIVACLFTRPIIFL